MLLQARSHFNKVIDSSSGSAEALVRMNLLLYITIPPGICHFVPPRREHWHGTELENTEWPRKAARECRCVGKGNKPFLSWQEAKIALSRGPAEIRWLFTLLAWEKWGVLGKEFQVQLSLRPAVRTEGTLCVPELPFLTAHVKRTLVKFA